MPKVPYFMVDRFDQFTKILPYEIWLEIYDVIRNDFKTKQNILEKMELITLTATPYSPWHYTGTSKRCVTSMYIMIPIPAIQFEVSSISAVHISQTYAFRTNFIGYYVTTSSTYQTHKSRPADYITTLSVPLI
jgi:hypothetical protein